MKKLMLVTAISSAALLVGTTASAATKTQAKVAPYQSIQKISLKTTELHGKHISDAIKGKHHEVAMGYLCVFTNNKDNKFHPKLDGDFKLKGPNGSTLPYEIYINKTKVTPKQVNAIKSSNKQGSCPKGYTMENMTIKMHASNLAQANAGVHNSSMGISVHAK